MAATESLSVIYGASFDIPYAIGSVVIPLTAVSCPSASPTTGTDSRRSATVGIAQSGTFSGASTAATDTRSSEETLLAPTCLHSGGSNVTTTVAAAAAAVPLPSSSSSRRRGVSSGNISSVRRCTHHRYCYLRDGGALEQDAFYRWLLHQQAQEQQHGQEQNEVKEANAETAPQSPSLLYASLACVVFLLPSSFPHRRRVLRRPPFLIEDDTWAEHMIEVQLHFLPQLRIPPVTIVHQSLLERRTAPLLLPQRPLTTAEVSGAEKGAEEEVREVWVPQLLAGTFGKPKLPPVAAHVVISSSHDVTSAEATCLPASTVHQASHHMNRNDSSSGDKSGGGTAASATVVVAEKVDTLRLYHPTVPVLQHVRRVAALSSSPVLRELHDAYTQLHFSTSSPASTKGEQKGEDGGEREGEEATMPRDTSLDTPFLFPWSLPYEALVAEYAAQRPSTSVAVLQAVLSGLKREREALEAACQRSMDEIAELATERIPEQLAEVYSRCLKLYRKER
ncbi:hypothetical protein N2W54_000396 [Lotmaria passim]